MNALITGISGFVGSHLAEHLLQAGDRVLGASHTGLGRPDCELPVRLITWDITQDGAEETCRRAVEEFAPDVIYHLAALSVPVDSGGFGEPSLRALAANVEGVRRVVRLAQSLPQRPRLLFTSSSHVYGAVDSADPRVEETSPCAPRSAYGRTKLAAEQICREAFEAGLDVIVVRSFPQAGPRQDARLMAAEWALQMAHGAVEIEVGNPNVTIDLTDVRDAVRAMRLLALHGGPGTTYNLGSGVPRTTGDVLHSLANAAGVTPRVRARDNRPRSDPIANIDRLTAAVAWTPFITLEQTAADVWSYWRDRVAAERRQSQQQQQ